MSPPIAPPSTRRSGLVRALAVETAKTGVTVNAVCPGYTDTELVRDNIARIQQATGRTQEDALAAHAQGHAAWRA